MKKEDTKTSFKKTISNEHSYVLEVIYSFEKSYDEQIKLNGLKNETLH